MIELSKHVFEHLSQLRSPASELGSSVRVAQLDRVFETFNTAKSFGMGMGLAISRSIIEAHHGWLWGSSNTPRGAVFQFTLPYQPGL